MEISKSEKVVRIISGILTGVFIIILILVKVANPAFKLGLFFLILVVIIIFFIGIVVAFHFVQKKNENLERSDDSIDKKLPPAITLEQARELAQLQLMHPLHADYFKGDVEETNELLGENIKSYVYSISANTVYSKQKYVIVMNRHFPNETLNILIEPSDADINRAKRLCATIPEKLPNIREKAEEDPLTGRKVTTKEIIHSPEDKKKEDDL